MHKIFKIKKISIATILIFLIFYGYYKKSRSLNVLYSPLPLYSQIGTVDAAKKISGAEGKEGFLVYGPYLPMKEGSYAISYKLSLANLNHSEDPQKIVGFCDVNVVDNPQYNVRYDLKITDFLQKNPRKILLRFFVPSHTPKVEFRIFQNSGQNISLEALRLSATPRYIFVLLKRLIVASFFYLFIGVPVLILIFWIAHKFLHLKPAIIAILFFSMVVLQVPWLIFTSTLNLLKGHYALSTQIGVRDEGKRWLTSKEGKNGFLVYGPYLPLGEGEYEIKYMLSFDNAEGKGNQALGFCDVNVVDVPQNAVRVELKREMFKKGNTANVKLRFSIPQGTHATEFRVFQYGGTNLTLRGLSLQPAPFAALVLSYRGKIFQNILYMCSALVFILLYGKFIGITKVRKIRMQYVISTLLSAISGGLLALIWQYKGYSVRQFQGYYDMWHVFYAPVWLPLIFIFFNFLYCINTYCGFNTDIEKYRRYDSYTLVIFPLFLIAALYYKNFNTQFVLGNFYLGILVIKSLIYFLFFWKNVKNRHQTAALDRNFKGLSFISILTVYILITPWVNASLHTDGDETLYLLKTQSIVKYNTFDISSAVQNDDCLSYHQSLKWANWKGAVTTAGTSLLLIPGYFLGGRFGAVVTMNIIGALLSLNLFMIVFFMTRDMFSSYWVFLISAFSVPLGIYSFLLYPEIIAAFLVLYCFRLIVSQSSGNKNFIILAIGAVVLLPFIKERFIIFSMGIMIALLYKLRKYPFMFMGILIGGVLGGVGFYFFDAYTWGGNGFSKIMGGLKPLLPEGYNWYSGLQGMFGLLCDQERGLLIYSPIFMLSFLGLMYLWQKQKKYALFFCVLLVPYYCLVAFGPNWFSGAGAPAPRYIVALIPLLAVLVGICIATSKKTWLRFLASILAIWSFVFYYVLILIPQWRVKSPNMLNGRNELLDRLYTIGLPNFTIVFPSYLKLNDITFYLTSLYLIGVVILTIFYLKQLSYPKETITRSKMVRFYGISFALCVFVSLITEYGYYNYQEFDALECYSGGGERKEFGYMLNGQATFLLNKIALRRNELVGISVYGGGNYNQKWPFLTVSTGSESTHTPVGTLYMNADSYFARFDLRYRAEESGLIPFWYEIMGYKDDRLQVWISKLTFYNLNRKDKLLGYFYYKGGQLAECFNWLEWARIRYTIAHNLGYVSS